MASILHAYPHVPPWTGFRPCLGIGLIDIHHIRLDQELAAIGHGIACIDTQVDNDLFDHPHIAMDHGCAISVLGVQLHVLTQQAMQHFGQIGDQFVDVKRLGLHDLFAAEHEKLPRQVRGPLCRIGDLLQCRLRIRAKLFFGLQQPYIPLNDCKQVVEIVRHTRRQLPHGVHFLRLSQLHLQIAPLRDIPADPHQTNDSSLRIFQRHFGGAQPPCLPLHIDRRLLPIIHGNPLAQHLEIIRVKGICIRRRKNIEGRLSDNLTG